MSKVKEDNNIQYNKKAIEKSNDGNSFKLKIKNFIDGFNRLMGQDYPDTVNLETTDDPRYKDFRESFKEIRKLEEKLTNSHLNTSAKAGSSNKKNEYKVKVNEAEAVKKVTRTSKQEIKKDEREI